MEGLLTKMGMFDSRPAKPFDPLDEEPDPGTYYILPPGISAISLAIKRLEKERKSLKDFPHVGPYPFKSAVHNVIYSQQESMQDKSSDSFYSTNSKQLKGGKRKNATT